VILDLEIHALSHRAPDLNELEVGAGYPFLLATKNLAIQGHIY